MVPREAYVKYVLHFKNNGDSRVDRYTDAGKKFLQNKGITNLDNFYDTESHGDDIKITYHAKLK